MHFKFFCCNSTHSLELRCHVQILYLFILGWISLEEKKSLRAKHSKTSLDSQGMERHIKWRVVKTLRKSEKVSISFGSPWSGRKVFLLTTLLKKCERKSGEGRRSDTWKGINEAEWETFFPLVRHNLQDSFFLYCKTQEGNSWNCIQKTKKGKPIFILLQRRWKLWSYPYNKSQRVSQRTR